MNCYFRQSWVDRRLAFDDLELDVLSLSVSTLERIWKPDTFFFNGRRSRLHKITTPNKFVRLYRTGQVLYSARCVHQGCYSVLLSCRYSAKAIGFFDDMVWIEQR